VALPETGHASRHHNRRCYYRPVHDSPLLEERRGATLILTLNRPERRNALSPSLSARLLDAMTAADADPSVRVVVLTGAGSAFCSGMDLKAFSEGERPTPPDAANIYSFRGSKPLIGAVNGPAVAGGFELALACDLVVAARSAFFALPEVKRGLIAGGGGIFRLARLAGLGRAMRMLLTGDALNAEEALAAGIVAQVVEPAEVLTVALAIADAITKAAPRAVAETLAIARQSFDIDQAALWSLTAAAWARVVDSDEAGEGALAFLDKRDPVWPSIPLDKT
jgi:enoyl-CoA hydratase/carnithine racemase